MSRSREHAVVLGGSMAGLVTARVLSEHYARVTVVERDGLPTAGEQRRGVPQGRHVHALLPRGGEVLEELFPGIVAELSGAGAPLVADASQMHFEVLGHRLSRDPSPLQPVGVQASRPFLEGAVRRRVRGLANVEVLDGHDVLGLVATPGRERVTGVRVERHGEGVERELAADLVVDSMGRAGRTPAALEEWGYPRPAEESVEVDIAYTSVPVRLRPGALDGSLFLIGPRPDRMTSMGLFAYEDDVWLLTVMGYGAARPQPDLGSMLDRVREMAPAAVVAALTEAEPLDDVRVHRYPASRRRRYEKVARFPEGLLVTGDALCSFNPVYGQGMTVAAVEAIALRRVLTTTTDDASLSRRFFRAAAAHVDVAWKLSVGSDLALPEVPGERSLEVRAVNRYLGRLLAVAEDDALVAARFLRVIGFLDPPTALFRPRVAARVLRGPRRARSTAPMTAELPTRATRVGA